MIVLCIFPVAIFVVDARMFVNIEFLKDFLEFIDIVLEDTLANTPSDTSKTEMMKEMLATQQDPAVNMTVSCQFKDTEVVILKNPRASKSPSIIGHVMI